MKEVEMFYLKPYMSVVHSTKATVSNDNIQRQSLNQTIQETHAMFKKESNSNISFSKFAEMKPKQVKQWISRNFEGFYVRGVSTLHSN
jgi:hypothetical protein